MSFYPFDFCLISFTVNINPECCLGFHAVLKVLISCFEKVFDKLELRLDFLMSALHHLSIRKPILSPLFDRQLESSEL
jgi:hypothetical protein